MTFADNRPTAEDLTSATSATDVLKRCRTLYEQGHNTEALSLARDCVARAQRENDPIAHFHSLTALGHILLAQKDYAGALAAHKAALTLAEKHHDTVRAAKAWNNLGIIFLTGAAPDLAIECFCRASRTRTLARNEDGHARRINLALCYWQMDQVRLGLRHARQAFSLERPEVIAANPYGYIDLRHVFVQLALKSGRVPRAEILRRADEARTFAREHPDHRSRLLVALIEGSLTVAFSDRAAGIAQLEATLADTRHTPDLMPASLWTLIEAEKLMGRADRAQAYLAEWYEHIFHDADLHSAELHLENPLPRRLARAEARTMSEWWAATHSIPYFSRWARPIAGITLSIDGRQATKDPATVNLKSAYLTTLRLLSEGKRAKEIAEKLGITEKTIRNNLSDIYKQIGVTNSKAAVAYFLHHRQMLETGTPIVPTAGAWYLSRLMDRACKIACQRWWNTPDTLRPVEARLAVCLMLILTGDSVRAQAEEKHLTGRAATLFYLWQRWYNGHHESLAELNSLAQQAPFESRIAVRLAVCHGAQQRGLFEIAHQTSYQMMLESLKVYYIDP